MGNNEIKEIILSAVNNTAGLEFHEQFQPIDNGKLMRNLCFRGINRITHEKVFIYANTSPSEEELSRDLILFIRPFLISGIISNTLDINKI